MSGTTAVYKMDSGEDSAVEFNTQYVGSIALRLRGLKRIPESRPAFTRIARDGVMHDIERFRDHVSKLEQDGHVSRAYSRAVWNYFRLAKRKLEGGSLGDEGIELLVTCLSDIHPGSDTTKKSSRSGFLRPLHADNFLL